MSLSYLLQQTLNALQLAGFYALLSVSYVLMHAVTGRTNLAFGALAAWSGYLLIQGSLTLMLLAPGRTIGPVMAALGLAVFNTAIVGLALERVVIRRLIGATGLAMLIATFGAAFVLEELMRILNASREIWLMPVLSEGVELPGLGERLHVSRIGLVILGLAVMLCLGLVVLIARHPFGRAWRACSEDAGMAALCGVDIGRTVLVTVLIASAYAGTAGALMAVYYGAASFCSGLVIGLKTLFIAVIGGLDSLWGALLGALLLALLETYWSGYLDMAYRDVASFAVLTGLLILNPRGLLATGTRIDHRQSP